jgi:hypothetical protein
MIIIIIVIIIIIIKFWQVLYLDHSLESLALGGPWMLGAMAPGASRWRVLRETETELHGGSSRRRLYGCAVTLQRAPAPPPGGGNAGFEGQAGGGGMGLGAPLAGGEAPGSGPPVYEQLLLTWSQVRLPPSCCPQYHAYTHRPSRGLLCVFPSLGSQAHWSVEISTHAPARYS